MTDKAVLILCLFTGDSKRGIQFFKFEYTTLAIHLSKQKPSAEKLCFDVRWWNSLIDVTNKEDILVSIQNPIQTDESFQYNKFC